MRRITFVTTNAGKVAEVAEGLARHGIEVVQDARGYPEVQADSLAEVTESGADWLLRAGLPPPFLLEDSGLFVDALGGFPGVYSRYALDTIGTPGLLRLLGPGGGRSASFRTDLLLVDGAGVRRHFEGTCRGTIAQTPAGTAGFGFDPVFVPAGHDRTFAEMGRAEKGAVSHRGEAVRRFLAAAIQTAKP
ncbi:MAG: RdgB/HAM1 family non-canonical purine NTP pyrophosphatase [Thermoplasmatota archaeon]